MDVVAPMGPVLTADRVDAPNQGAAVPVERVTARVGLTLGTRVGPNGRVGATDSPSPASTWRLRRGPVASRVVAPNRAPRFLKSV